MNRISIRVSTAYLLAAVFAGFPVAAEQPKATASAAEIMASWSSICLGNAGDPTAQRKAAENDQPKFPIQVQFVGNPNDPICIVISALDPKDSYADLVSLSGQNLDMQNLSDLDERENSMSAVSTIDDRRYRISLSTKFSQGQTVAMAIIGEMKERQ